MQSGRETVSSHFKYQRATLEDDLPNEHFVPQVQNATYETQYIKLNSEYGTKCCLHNSVSLTPNFVNTNKVITGMKMAFQQIYIMDSCISMNTSIQNMLSPTHLFASLLTAIGMTCDHIFLLKYTYLYVV
jgi:hypothetical protein